MRFLLIAVALVSLLVVSCGKKTTSNNNRTAGHDDLSSQLIGQCSYNPYFCGEYRATGTVSDSYISNTQSELKSKCEAQSMVYGTSACSRSGAVAMCLTRTQYSGVTVSLNVIFSDEDSATEYCNSRSGTLTVL